MKIKHLIFIFTMISSSFSYGQNFLDGNFTFSKKKESYITLADGTELKGTIQNIDRKKGLIEEIKIKDGKGKKIKLKPEEVKFMYIAPSNYDKFSNAYSKLDDMSELAKDRSLNQSYIKDGYAYFESTEVMIKKKKMTLLLQLLNPGFGSKIKVYFDPYAKETMSVGIAGMKVAGGNAKSYYFKKGDNVAFRMFKKNYEEEINNLYGDCPDLKKEFNKKMGWVYVEKHIFFYDQNCN